MIRRGSREAAAVALLLAVAVVATWPLGAHLATTVPGDLGDPLEYVYLVGWAAHAITEQPLALFDANMFFPSERTLLFSENLLGFALPLAPLTRLTGNPLLATNVGILASYAVAGVGVRRLVLAVGGSQLSSLLAATAFVVAPYRVASVTHVHVLALHLLPFAVLAMVRLSREPRGRWAALVAALVAWQLWTSLTAGAMTLLALGATAACVVVRERGRAARFAAFAGIAVAAGVAAAAPLLLAYRATVADNPAYSHPPVEERDNSATLASYLHPHRGGRVVDDVYAELASATAPSVNSHEKTLFPGLWLAIASAGVVIACVRRRDDVLDGDRGLAVASATAIAAVGLVLSLGPAGGAYLVLRAMGGGLGRVPARFGVLVTFALAVAAGAVLGRLRGRTAALVAVGSGLLLAIEAWPGAVVPSRPPDRNAAHRELAGTSRRLLVLPTLEYAGPGVPIVASVVRETQVLWFATEHYRPMTNGYGAFVPEPYADIATGVQVFPSESAFAMLRRLGIDTVVLETGLLHGTRWEAVPAAMRSWPGARLVVARDGTEVWDVQRAR